MQSRIRSRWRAPVPKFPCMLANVLAALGDFGIEIPTSCCGGICGACKVGWLGGKPIHRDRVLSPYERERYLMACVAGSDSERLVLDL